MLNLFKKFKPEEIKEEIEVNQAEALRIAKEEYAKKQKELDQATKNLQKTFQEVIDFAGYWRLQSNEYDHAKQYISVIRNYEKDDYYDRVRNGYKVTIIIPTGSRRSYLYNDNFLEQMIGKFGRGASMPYTILYSIVLSSDDLEKTFKSNEIDLISKEFFKEKLNEYFGV